MARMTPSARDTTTAMAMGRILRLPTAVAFWALGATLLAFMCASSAPSPLYVVYQARWGFSAATLTLVFAAYALALLLALVTVGGLSDYVGRRPVLTAAIAVEALSMALFMAAGGVGWLLAARVAQGLATGAAIGALSAALLDLQPAGRPRLAALVTSAAPNAGLAAGALGSGLLAQDAPAPTATVFALLLVAFAAALLGVAFVPETVARRPGALASLRPHVGVPRRARRAFLAVVPCLVATWALGGLYLSLGPSLAATALRVQGHPAGGLVIAALMGMGVVGSVALRGASPRRAMAAGSVGLAAGVAATLLALVTISVPLFFLGAAVAGVGFGAAVLGSFRAVSLLAEPGERAGLLTAVYVVSYLAFSLPTIAAGVATSALGLRQTAAGYGVAVILLAVATLFGLVVQQRREARRAAADRRPPRLAARLP